MPEHDNKPPPPRRSHSEPPTEHISDGLRWQYALFGIAEPVVNVATTLFITVNSTAFVRLLFSDVQMFDVRHAGLLVPTLTRMYASVLLCFGLTQAMLWHGWRWSPTADSRQAARTWMLGMLVPDFHHLIVAYGPYLVGPHGRIDSALIAHYTIQGLLTLFRLAFLLHLGDAPKSKKL